MENPFIIHREMERILGIPLWLNLQKGGPPGVVSHNDLVLGAPTLLLEDVLVMPLCTPRVFEKPNFSMSDNDLQIMGITGWSTNKIEIELNFGLLVAQTYQKWLPSIWVALKSIQPCCWVPTLSDCCLSHLKTMLKLLAVNPSLCRKMYEKYMRFK